MAFTVTQQINGFLTKYRDLSRADILALLQEVYDTECLRLRLTNDSEDFALVSGQRTYAFDVSKATVLRVWDAALVYNTTDPSPLNKMSVRQFEVGGRVPRVQSSDYPQDVYQELSLTSAKQLGLSPPPSFSTLAVSSVSNASPVVVGTTVAHGLADGVQVYVQDVGGNTAANGLYYARVSAPYGSTTTFSLYADSAFASPVVGNGAYTTGGLVATSTGPFMRVWVTRKVTLGEATGTTSLPDSITELDYLNSGMWLKHSRHRHKDDLPENTALWHFWEAKMRQQITSLMPDVTPRYEPYIRRTARSRQPSESRMTGDDARRS